MINQVVMTYLKSYITTGYNIMDILLANGNIEYFVHLLSDYIIEHWYSYSGLSIIIFDFSCTVVTIKIIVIGN